MGNGSSSSSTPTRASASGRPGLDSDDEYEVEAVRRDRDSYYDRRRSSPSIRREDSYEDNKSIRYPSG